MTSTDPAVLAAEAKVAADIAKAQADAVADAAQQTFDLNALDALVPPPPVVVVTPPPVVTPPTSPVIYFAPTDLTRLKVVQNPRLDPLWTSGAWTSKFTNMLSAVDTSPQYGFPINIAEIIDPEITIPGQYQNATCRLPQNLLFESAADGHCMIVEPIGVSPVFPQFQVVTEFGAVQITGTWPNQKITLGNNYTPCQFICDNSGAAICTRNVAGLTQAQVLAGQSGSPGSSIGAAFSGLGGLVRQADVKAGVVNHAVTASCSWGGDGNTFRAPALIGKAGSPGGIPYGAKIQINRSFVIPNSATPYQAYFVKVLQEYGVIVGDTLGSSGNAIIIEAQRADGTDAAYAALDEQNGNTLGSGWMAAMWANYARVLASIDGS